MDKLAQNIYKDGLSIQEGYDFDKVVNRKEDHLRQLGNKAREFVREQLLYLPDYMDLTIKYKEEVDMMFKMLCMTFSAMGVDHNTKLDYEKFEQRILNFFKKECRMDQKQVNGVLYLYLNNHLISKLGYTYFVYDQDPRYVSLSYSEGNNGIDEFINCVLDYMENNETY